MSNQFQSTPNLKNYPHSKDKKTNTLLNRVHHRHQLQTQRNKLSELLHNFQPGYLIAQTSEQQTLKVKQYDIVPSLNIQTASNMFDLKLSYGNYCCNYTHNGSSLLLYSSQGHLSLIDWRNKSLKLQLHLHQNIFDGKFLHNDEMFALSQLTGTYIYDNKGIELHKVSRSLGLEYLRYHFLLVGYDQKKLRYYDTTVGNVVAEHVLKGGRYSVMRQNKSNGVIAMGTEKGVVEWWTPGVGNACVKVFVGGKVDDVGFYKGYMYTAAEKVKVWDMRMLKVVEELEVGRGVGLDVSDRGVLAVGLGWRVEMWKDLHVGNCGKEEKLIGVGGVDVHKNENESKNKESKLPYMKHSPASWTNTRISNLQFVPFQDFLGLGTNHGFSCIVVPGSGNPHYDSYQSNPFQTSKQKRQSLVHNLLDKLPSQTITIDPNILGSISQISRQVLQEEQRLQQQKKDKERIMRIGSKNKMKGKGKIGAKMNRKNIQLEKMRRRELTKHVNTRLWAKWAEKRKKEKEIGIIQEMEKEGFGVAQLMERRGGEGRGNGDQEKEERVGKMEKKSRKFGKT